MKRFLLIIVWLIGLVSSIYNIKYQLRIEELIKEKEQLILEIKKRPINRRLSIRRIIYGKL